MTLRIVQRRWCRVCAVLLVAISTCSWQKDPIYSDPPASFQDSQLVGLWEARYDLYASGVDTLTIRADGTFQQAYHNADGYTYTTAPDGRWYVERLWGGRIYLHLQGARFYDEGVRIAERDGIFLTAVDIELGVPGTAMPFWDPVTRDVVHMVGELVLTVRGWSEAPGGLVLKHMWRSGDDMASGEFFVVETR